MRIYVRVKVLRETLTNPFLSTTWEHPLDIHVGPAATTLPLSAALSLFSPTSSLQHAHLLPHNRCYVYTWP